MEPRRLHDVISEMNELNHRFRYFVDEGSGRARVIYMRYDGHYGLIRVGPVAGRGKGVCVLAPLARVAEHRCAT